MVDHESDFAIRLLTWFDQHGRHDLPWQHPRSPYRVWLSEVMLQQTQVATVIPYFQRFVAALHDLRTLAAAPMDQVLALWSGLGYYSRARNLHRSALLCIERHAGELPASSAELTALPGIGRSTAGAILALAFDQRAPILDGNVRRVLIRHCGIEGDPLSPRVQAQLWKLSESLLPRDRVTNYTQAIMDLGATVCTRTQPRCATCPLNTDCIALRDNRTAELPHPRRRATRTQRECHALIMRDRAGRVLLERRPVSGVWGGLFSLPEYPDAASLRAANIAPCAAPTGDDGYELPAGAAQAANEPSSMHALPVIHHAFTHFDLRLHPVLVDIVTLACAVSENNARRWFTRNEFDDVGLPAPIRSLLERLPEPSHDS